jgi:hemolysin activation/secretion protein
VSGPIVESNVWSVTRRAFHISLAIVLATTLTVSACRPALAQTPQLNALPPVPQGNPIERVEPKQLPAVSPGGTALPLPEELEVPAVPPIAVNQVQLLGAHLFEAELLASLQDLKGPATSLNDLNKARERILLHYRKRGYPLVAVSLHVDRPSGVVTYNVTEGRIVDVRLEGEAGKEGDVGPAGEMVLKILRNLTKPEVIDSDTLERYLLLAQDVPGITLSTVLNPSSTDPGALTLIAQVSRSGLAIPGAPYGSLSGQASFDNRAFQLTGPIEGLGVLDLNGLTAWGDKTEFSFYHTFPNSQNFGQISTEFLIGSDGWKIRIYGGEGVNYPTGSLAALQYAGFTDIFGTQVSYPVIRTRQQSLNVYVALDALESTIDNGTPAAQTSADEVRVLRLGQDYTRWDNLLGSLLGVFHGDAQKQDSLYLPATDILQVRLSRGLDFLGGYHGPEIPPSVARQNEQHNFTAIKFEASRTQTLFRPWEGASVALMAFATGQWTPSVLPPAEEFYLGGARFTRGFYSGQVPGDKALAATGELQLNTVIDLSWVGASKEMQSQFYMFYDWGEVWQNLATNAAAHLASAGGGTRLQVTKNVELDLEALARLTTHPPPATSDMNGIGLYWRIVGRF